MGKLVGNQPDVKLARLLRDTFIECYVRENPHHNNPAFAEINGVGALGWELFARALLRRGLVMPARIQEETGGIDTL